MAVEPKLTVLLGMNGAGKSSILQLFALMRDLAMGNPSKFFDERGWDRKALRFRASSNRSTILRVAAIFDSDEWGAVRWVIRWGLNTGELQSEAVQLKRVPEAEPIDLMRFDRKSGGETGAVELPALRFKGSLLSAVQDPTQGTEESELLKALYDWLSHIQSLELLSPSAMKGGTRLSAGDIGSRGDRLAGFLAALRPEQRSRVVQRVGLFYPLAGLETVRKRAGWIDLILSEHFSNLGEIPSTQMSDGFMRLLALCAIPELPAVSLILLDEVEDGIEPHILGKLVSLVAEETTAQIIATSHSPILANVVGPAGLRLIFRTDEGRTTAVKVDTLPAFRMGSDYLGAGELWSNTSLKVLEAELRRAADATPKNESDAL